MAVYGNDVRFALQPLYSLHTGGMIAVEALARPSGCSARELLGRARRDGRLIETDIALAAMAVGVEAEQQTLLPLHINLLAVSATARPDTLDPLLDALAKAGRRPREVVLELGPPFGQAEPTQLLAGIEMLRELGFQLALDGLGVGDVSLGVLAAARVDLIKIDRVVLRNLPSDAASRAVVEGLLHFAALTDARVIATGIETDAELAAARKLGVRFVQGNLFAPAQGRLPMSSVFTAAPATPSESDRPALSTIGAPTVADFIRPPTTLPATATCDEARDALASSGQPTALVGLDEDGRPHWTIDRNRFLLSFSGQYGHALHANRPAARFADVPYTILAHASALEMLDMVTRADSDRMSDDIVVVDGDGVCMGIVRVPEVVRGVAEAKIEEAASLNPLTRLPSSDTIAKDVERRIASGEPFVVAWLDVDHFKQVNDTVGFAAGDQLIRTLGRTLTDLASLVRKMTVSHVGGDDFLIASDVDEIATLAPRLLDKPWETEGMQVSVSLAGLVCAPGSVKSYPEVSRLLAPLKKRAKNVSGSSWVLGRPGVERVDVLRGRTRFDEGVGQGVA
ncbi:MAG: EAL domain-containing protein [Haloechinothrix sp.]